MTDKESPESWPLPEFEGETQETEETNAFGMKPDWFKDEVESEEEEDSVEIKPLTIEDIESLRQAAFEEGQAEGQQEGLAKGLEEGRLKGLEEGHQQGLSQGLEQGLAQGQEQIDNLAGRWLALIEKLEEPVQQVNAQVQQQVVEMAMAIAAEIVRCELTMNPDIIVQTVKEAVAALPVSQQQVDISLHPEDLMVIEGVYPEQTREKKNWQLLADGSLSQGDCVVETQLSSVSVSMEQVISQALKRFLMDNAQSNTGGIDGAD